MLSVNQLTVCCGESGLLDDVTFSVKSGEKVGIVGASGSGKTILAYALLGHCPDGFEMKGAVDCGGDIALVPQSAACLNPTTRIDRQLAELAYSDDEYRKVVKHCQLDEVLLHKYPGELSGGMAKRALIALGLVQGKEIIVADEPTSGLDHARSEQLLSLLTSPRLNQQAMIIISHDIVALTRHVDRLLVFRDGQLVDDVTIEPGWDKGCHPYTHALWQAAPEHWFNDNEEHYAKSA